MKTTGAANTLGKRMAIVALSVITAVCLAFPSLALAEISVDGQELSQGDNSVGGGTATLTDSVLDMVNVAIDDSVVGGVYTNEDLTINFNGGNKIAWVDSAGSANVTLNFEGDNEVEDVVSEGNSNVTVNANGNNEFEEVSAYENSTMTINVTGENDFANIKGYDDASIVIRGTDCQKKDTVNLGKGESSAYITTDDGNLTIDHVTINVESVFSVIGSEGDNVVIDTSKIAKEGDSEFIEIMAGGTLKIAESVIEITGDVWSNGKMTIDHSDVEATDPGSKYSTSPYRVRSKTGIDLIDEENGEVKQADLDGETVWYVDTGDGRDVDLEADGEPGYYKCKGDGDGDGLPATGESSGLQCVALLALCAMGVAIATKPARKPRGKHAR